MQTRQTFQKTLTLDAVKALKNHPTADQVYAYVAEKYPEISRATIYRNLNQLSECGEIHRVKNPCGADRFEALLTPHFHFICQSCNNLINVEIEHSENLIERCQDKIGGMVNEEHIFFGGICKNCLKK